MGLFSITPEKAVERLEKAVVKLGRKKAIRNAVLHVDSPRTGVRGTWATGVAHQSDGSAMRPDTPAVDARRVRNVEEQDRLSGRCSDSIGKCGDLIVVPRSHHLTHGARNYPERSFFVELGYDLGYSTVKAPR